LASIHICAARNAFAGTPALTTRGFKEEDMKVIGQTISQVLKNPKEAKISQAALKTVAALVKKYPLYPELNK